MVVTKLNYLAVVAMFLELDVGSREYFLALSETIGIGPLSTHTGRYL